MRVIAGDFKGRRIVAPKGEEVRPTPERVKEAIFSMVHYELPGAICLDLFAGTGALGIEALSRGASRVYFCEMAAPSLAALKKNLDACLLEPDRAIVLKTDWRGAVQRLREKCNLVFIDAPYEMWEHYLQILEALSKYGALAGGATIVIERSAGAGSYGIPAGFEKVREKRYGSVGVDLLVFTDDGDRMK